MPLLLSAVLLFVRPLISGLGQMFGMTGVRVGRSQIQAGSVQLEYLKRERAKWHGQKNLAEYRLMWGAF